MRLCLVLACLAALAPAQQLRVKSATAQSVQLEWTAVTGAVSVERTAGTVTKTLATVDTGSYEDRTIDRFGTYRYRISAAGKSSNEVVVGPPPSGILNASPLPQGADPGKYGLASAIALDENSDPLVAFEWVDPNGDGDYTDNEIRFVRWSRGAYRWLPSVRVRIVGEIGGQNANPLSIACDRATGHIAIVTPIGDKGASVFHSADGGATFKETALPGVAGQLGASAMAAAGGRIHLIVAASESGAHYLTGPFDDVASWKAQPLPASAGWKQALNVNVAIALDRAAQPVIAWFETPEEGDTRRYQVWRPGSAAPVTAVELKRGPDTPDLALAIGGPRTGLLFSAPLDEKDDDHGVWYTQSSDGAVWSKPSKLPVDGPRTTNPPLAVALDSRGAIIAVFGSNGGSSSTVCNFPALSRSTDGVAWKTCGPGKAEGGDFGPQPAMLHVIQVENDKAYVMWQEQAENKYRQGMLLWHER